MIGIVVVSHSPKLAEAAFELAREMVPDVAPRVALAAGTGDGLTGTDATRVAAAITEVASPDGVLVLMDLGSAVLSAELALEFAGDVGGEVRLSSAPIVEGLLAAVVRAAGGASLDEVDREARGALAGKESQLGVVASGRSRRRPLSPTETAPRSRSASCCRTPRDFTRDPRHSSSPLSADSTPRSRCARATRSLSTAAARSGSWRSVRRQGDEIVVAATGEQSADALAAVRTLIETSFGE